MNQATKSVRAGLVFWLGLCAHPLAAQQSETWPQFRGQQFNPVVDNSRLPEKWSTTENVEWSTEVPGRGWSSPIVVDGKIFVTAVVTDGESKLPQTGTDYSNEYVDELTKQGLSEEEVNQKVMDRDFELPDQVSLHYWLYCFDLNSGAEIWKQEFHSGKPPGGRHRKNSFSSESPVTDGKLVYVYITNLGLYAYDLAGKSVWSKPLDTYPVYMEFGTGSSPVLCDDKLIIVNDNEKSSFVAAFDKSSGAQLWRTERVTPADHPAGMPKSGWATPYIWRTTIADKPHTEIVTAGPGQAISYDLEGQELWRLTGITAVPAASSFAIDGVLYLNGGRGKPFYAIRSGATGELAVKPGADPNEFVLWTSPLTGTYIPTPVAYHGGLYILSDNGIITKVDLKTGEKKFKSRVAAVGTAGADFTTSPWAYNGKVFCHSEQGDTYVFAAGDESKLLHVNSLDDLTLASPAIVGDRVLLRTEKRLYSIRQIN